tara:strand:+ start:565 stop:1158 length:594 start_codon:yes stop_codon:yes gene_type:complete
MELPIFPLNGAVLFPGTSLPLNIFENRYIEMVNYSLARDRCIGMIQSDNNNKLYNVGCIGKIHSFNETNDGRYLISLQGINCFKIVKELDQNYNFRMVYTEVIENDESIIDLSDKEKENLLKKYREYIRIKNINLNLEEIEGIDISQIIKFIAMVSPFRNEDKQVLLETQKLGDFYNRLLSIIEIEISGNYSNKTIN